MCENLLWVQYLTEVVPDSKVHGANMGPTWVLLTPDGPHVGPVNLVIQGCSSRAVCSIFAVYIILSLSRYLIGRQTGKSLGIKAILQMINFTWHTKFYDSLKIPVFCLVKPGTHTFYHRKFTIIFQNCLCREMPYITSIFSFSCKIQHCSFQLPADINDRKIEYQHFVILITLMRSDSAEFVFT